MFLVFWKDESIWIQVEARAHGRPTGGLAAPTMPLTCEGIM